MCTYTVLAPQLYEGGAGGGGLLEHLHPVHHAVDLEQGCELYLVISCLLYCDLRGVCQGIRLGIEYTHYNQARDRIYTL